MSADDITKTTAAKPKQHDWRRFDAMTAKERHAAAMADPDAKPMTERAWKRARRGPHVKVVRLRLKLSQDAFAAQFGIPLGTLRDWEQGRKEPDAAARAYLRVISVAPDAVRKALAARPPAAKARADAES